MEYALEEGEEEGKAQSIKYVEDGFEDQRHLFWRNKRGGEGNLICVGKQKYASVFAPFRRTEIFLHLPQDVYRRVQKRGGNARGRIFSKRRFRKSVLVDPRMNKIPYQIFCILPETSLFCPQQKKHLLDLDTFTSTEVEYGISRRKKKLELTAGRTWYFAEIKKMPPPVYLVAGVASDNFISLSRRRRRRRKSAHNPDATMTGGEKGGKNHRILHDVLVIVNTSALHVQYNLPFPFHKSSKKYVPKFRLRPFPPLPLPLSPRKFNSAKTFCPCPPPDSGDGREEGKGSVSLSLFLANRGKFKFHCKRLLVRPKQQRAFFKMQSTYKNAIQIFPLLLSPAKKKPLAFFVSFSPFDYAKADL